jgi:uncharacterized RDD family membrane protein YckC
VLAWVCGGLELNMVIVGRHFAFGPFWSLGLGGWGRLVEFCVFLVYFGVLNSSIAGGQTIFKRIMKIQVIDRSGHCISPGRSFLRSAVLFDPFFCLTGLVMSPVKENAIPVSVALPWFGLVSAYLYLYFVNLRTRQSLHDVIAGTFVAQKTPRGQVVGSIWRTHLIVVGIWLVVVDVLLVLTILADPWALSSWVTLRVGAD